MVIKQKRKGPAAAAEKVEEFAKAFDDRTSSLNLQRQQSSGQDYSLKYQAPNADATIKHKRNLLLTRIHD